jgi:hypothetical protein
MRTRTLLLLAVSCGLVILVAGGIWLLRLDGASEAGSVTFRIGDTAQAADLRITVLSATERDATMEVEVRTSGVDDQRGFESFTLLTADVLSPVDPGDDPNGCRATTVAEQTCTLRFDTSAAPTEGVRVLVVRRGEDVRRWSLTPTG